jgi:hypothetical protein
MTADGAKSLTVTEIDHRPDHAELAVWATIALIDIVMFVLAVVSANLDLGAAAMTLIGP